METALTAPAVAADMIRSRKEPTDRSGKMILKNYLAIEQARAMADRPLEQSQVLGLHEMLTRETLDDVSVAGRPQTPHEERVEVVDNRGLMQGNAQRLTSKRDSSSRGFSHSGSSSAASR